MRALPKLFQNNRAWSEQVHRETPDFFHKLASQQTPEYLWIGCSDSRVPANEIVGLLPGELFVHRNVANLVVHTDLNCLSATQFAVDVLKVRHIIVCGHYGCSGIHAAFHQTRLGLSDNWLRHVQDIREKHRAQLADLESQQDACDLLCELNVIEQAANVCQTTIAQDAWDRGQELTVHGWIYGLRDGLLRDLGFTAGSRESLVSTYLSAISRLTGSKS